MEKKKKKPNPNQKVVRVHANTLISLKREADRSNYSVPELIDIMWSTYQLYKNAHIKTERYMEVIKDGN